jgi:hypothetical protein
MMNVEPFSYMLLFHKKCLAPQSPINMLFYPLWNQQNHLSSISNAISSVDHAFVESSSWVIRSIPTSSQEHLLIIISGAVEYMVV